MAAQPLDVETAWQLVLQAVNRSDVTLGLPESSEAAVRLNGQGAWHLLHPATPQAKDVLSLFLPLCKPLAPGTPSRVVGQLGQSLDGRIATVTGRSRFINGSDGITHLHRIRAVSDAVIVGAGTAMTDNPRLTVRRTQGPNPVRVVIDRHRRVPDGHHLFTDDEAPTLRLVAGRYKPRAQATLCEGVTEVPCLGDDRDRETVNPTIIIQVLADFGLRKIFVEGGGVTVSAFLRAGLLDRLHVMVAPMIIGSGRPAFSLPEIDLLEDALRPRSRLVNLGSDMLFDLDFS
ncbi:RibD family protein [Marinobacter sp. M216]|uniref:RibD family protein n=1 Tax=Marinobacter albus TaxID=3030833 RepID=A0ABT7HCQ3_9GAMM|nr:MULTISPECIES: RibD family protein [unclassified Marinobacter]MBW7470091.1 RibD family protein [Marinobacter sp. F4218]MDK9557645.1 RibD family protein [Marinobacter sp. M216]